MSNCDSPPEWSCEDFSPPGSWGSGPGGCSWGSPSGSECGDSPPWGGRAPCENRGTTPPPPPQQPGPFAVLKNPQTGLVLDAAESTVKIQNYTGSDSQLWKIEPAENGRSFIVNKSTGNVLDDQGERISTTLITLQKHGGLSQQWTINANDGTITSSTYHLAVDVEKGELSAGNMVIAYPKHGRDNQQFQVVQI